LNPPELKWGPSAASGKLEDSYHSAEERRLATKRGITERLTHRERLATPLPFRDLLLDMARMAIDD
jgi:hypothetical protein